jgi:hypothetical protein
VSLWAHIRKKWLCTTDGRLLLGKKKEMVTYEGKYWHQNILVPEPVMIYEASLIIHPINSLACYLKSY